MGSKHQPKFTKLYDELVKNLDVKNQDFTLSVINKNNDGSIRIVVYGEGLEPINLNLKPDSLKCEYRIQINGIQHIVTGDYVTYDSLVKIAGLSLFKNGKIEHKITYTNSPYDDSGNLHEGEYIRIQDDTCFRVF